MHGSRMALGGFPWGLSDKVILTADYKVVAKNPPASAGDAREVGLIPESGRSPGGGNGNPFQYSCQENPMESGA